MKVRLLISILLFLLVSINGYAGSITFNHGENVKVKLQDAVYPQLLSFSPEFAYSNSTRYHLSESDFHFYLLTLNNSKYYLWIKDTNTDFEIEVSNPEMEEDNIVIVSIDQWQSGELNTPNSDLEKINAIDVYYALALDSLNKLATTDDTYSAEIDHKVIVWDHRSAKRLFNFSIEYFTQQFEEGLIYFSPAYALYWQLMYKLYYQYFHTNAFKGLTKMEMKSKIEDDFQNPESRLLVFHHFFRKGLPLLELEENYQLFRKDLSNREIKLAQSLIQNQKIKETSFNSNIDFIFGIDIDGAMEGYVARDSSQKQTVLVFWSIWNKDMATEFNLLADLKRDYNTKYNFVHICIDAYETPEKSKSFIYQNRVGGYHLMPEQSNAFRKSKYKKEFKIRDLPFYLIMDNEGEIIQTEAIPLMISDRLEEKLKMASTKK
ncbi:thioredoxin-like domain-containing protein [Marivirga sp.]|uniref:thioredoxin-like domain-containing protein n=1 Tax=Marivirga sp. TaxID=2018662 RepID=UPI003DA79D89